MTRYANLLPALFLSFATAACVGGQIEIDDVEPNENPGGASGGEGNTYDHPDIEVDVWTLLERLQQEGPPKYTSRVHSCPKIRYRTIGNILAARGVNLGNTAEDTAGQMYTSSAQALGAPNYGARSRENLDLTTASASKLFDIFGQAAPEIIAQMPSLDECTVGGVPAQMFNELDQCTADGIACLTGLPATASHIELCNFTVQNASDVEVGKQMAVALIAASAHTCE